MPTVSTRSVDALGEMTRSPSTKDGPLSASFAVLMTVKVFPPTTSDPADGLRSVTPSEVKPNNSTNPSTPIVMILLSTKDADPLVTVTRATH